MKGSFRVLSLLVAFLFLYHPFLFGWGSEGHVYVNQVAAQKIPATMPAFLKAAVPRIAYLGLEPDRWRERSEATLKNAQEPDHYIDLELLAGFGDLPRGRYQFYDLLCAKRAAIKTSSDALLPEKIGLQPYAAIEVYDRLKVAFREFRRLRAANQPTEAVEQNIVFYAGWLGHYVADGSQPLHTTIHFDGWKGLNPNGYRTRPGIHKEFETDFVARNLGPKDFADLVEAPVRLTDPFEDYMRYLRNSNALVEKVYQLEKAGGFEGAGSPEALKFTEERLAAGSQMLLNLWYTAWLESAE
jgi:hypothetical protein